MNKPFYTSSVIVLIVMLLLLPTAQAADIELNDTCSLADAITTANNDTAVGGCPAGSGADKITLSGDITLTVALPHITSEITIEGNDRTISGNNRFRIFAVNSGMLTVNDLTMTKGKADWGGAIVNVNGGTLTINDSTILSSEAGEGGAIGNEANVTIRGSVLSENSADKGGAIHSQKGTVTLTASEISGNSVGEDGHGGAIYVEEGTLYITDSKVSENETPLSFGTYSKGGAVFIASGKLTVRNSDFHRNAAHNTGGAIHNERAHIIIDGSRFVDNAANYGGVLYNNLGEEVYISTSNFSGNSAKGSGGAIGNTWPYDIIIRQSIFEDNSAGKDGGAIYSSGEIEIYGSALVNNSAGENGGGISTSFLVTIESSTISGNNAEGLGGGLYLEDGDDWYGPHTLTHVSILHNAAANGGGLYKEGEAEAIVVNTIIASSAGSDCYGRLKENVANLIQDGSCFGALLGDPILGDLVEPEDGSPPYYPLQESSPAIDAAHDEYCPDTDITGTPRPQGDGCDIGAYEYIGSEDD